MARKKRDPSWPKGKICHEKEDWIEYQDGEPLWFKRRWCGQVSFSEGLPPPPDPNSKPAGEMPYHPYWDDPKNHCQKCLKAREAAGVPFKFKLKVVPGEPEPVP